MITTSNEFSSIEGTADECLRQGDYVRAEKLYGQICEHQPNHGRTWYMRGIACQRMGNILEACQYCQRAVDLLPGFAPALYNLAVAYHSLGQLDKSINIYQQLLQTTPDDVEALCMLGSIYTEQNRFIQAEQCYRKSIRLRTGDANLYVFLASAQLSAGDAVQAVENYQKAMQLGHGDISSVAGLAYAYEHIGKYDKALTLLQPYLSKPDVEFKIVLAYAKLCHRINSCEKAIALLEQQLESGELEPDDERAAHFELGRIYDSNGNYDKAFAYYRKGNDSKPVKFDHADDDRMVKKLIDFYNPTTIKRLVQATKKHKKIRPVFIVGMPRSGTSLVEQILDSHPEICGAGELPDIMDMIASLPEEIGAGSSYPDCLLSITQDMANQQSRHYFRHLSEIADARCSIVTDKTPANYQNLGFIQQLFPKARVIHCRRHPLDTCLSNYFLDFQAAHPCTYDLVNLGRVYKNYQRLMDHWKSALNLPILDVQYENLVANPENSIRDLLDFLDLKWSNRCLKFYENKRLVNTASYNQVKKPIYKTSISRWENYESYLEPLKRAMGWQE